MAIGLGIASLVLGGASAVVQHEGAASQARAQERESRRRKAIETARAKRETRVRQAQLLASQGASGARLSTVQEGVLGLESSLAGGLTDLAQQTSGQIEQFNIQKTQTQVQGALDLASTVGTFAVSDVGQDFFSGVETTPTGVQ
jgi:hypothetical protein